MFDFDILVKDPKGSIDFNVRSNDSFETFSSFQLGIPAKSLVKKTGFVTSRFL